MITTPQEKYRQAAVQTSPAQLLIMLYDGAIRFVRAGIKGIETEDLQLMNINFVKAQKIINELSVTLDRKYEISKNLYSLYEYMTYLLIQSNMKKDTAGATEALGYLMDLREAWVEASKLVAGSSEAN
ncbi:flagellar export chaperone FliS [Paenibacillus sp. JX-17]|uniref:Flagellar secretion chaperone FliS n=1 Tax=Paenibacillus lacisoli TaxID=3064525 RepID=A0ABT9CBE1_9BACL|nr:flagellar export chaperone FliS [Paenibacillus sp. JX-17]MDO7906571.1 flagellar export chaperone FliS [Paenibacillus sp. JX-17]